MRERQAGSSLNVHYARASTALGAVLPGARSLLGAILASWNGTRALPASTHPAALVLAERPSAFSARWTRCSSSCSGAHPGTDLLLVSLWASALPRLCRDKYTLIIFSAAYAALRLPDPGLHHATYTRRGVPGRSGVRSAHPAREHPWRPAAGRRLPLLLLALPVKPGVPLPHLAPLLAMGSAGRRGRAARGTKLGGHTASSFAVRWPRCRAQPGIALAGFGVVGAGLRCRHGVAQTNLRTMLPTASLSHAAWCCRHRGVQPAGHPGCRLNCSISPWCGGAFLATAFLRRRLGLTTSPTWAAPPDRCRCWPLLLLFGLAGMGCPARRASLPSC